MIDWTHGPAAAYTMMTAGFAVMSVLAYVYAYRLTESWRERIGTRENRRPARVPRMPWTADPNVQPSGSSSITP